MAAFLIKIIKNILVYIHGKIVEQFYTIGHHCLKDTKYCMTSRVCLLICMTEEIWVVLCVWQLQKPFQAVLIPISEAADFTSLYDISMVS